MKIAILAQTKAYLPDVRVHPTAAAEMDRESAEWMLTCGLHSDAFWADYSQTRSFESKNTAAT